MRPLLFDRLTAAQLAVLEWAEKIADDLIEVDAIAPRHGQHSMFHRMVKRGLLELDGRGVRAEDHMQEVDLYSITDLGRRALAARKGSK